MYDFSKLKKQTEEIETWLAREFSHIRTGRATASILDGIRVESYGTLMPINHLAGITVEDAKTILITPWDKSQLKTVETAIMNVGLGLSVTTKGDGIRVVFPDLTSERRGALLKVAREKLEEARVSVRKARDLVWDDIQKKERDGNISEDEKYRFKDEMQKIIDASNKKLEEMVERKEREISL